MAAGEWIRLIQYVVRRRTTSPLVLMRGLGGFFSYETVSERNDMGLTVLSSSQWNQMAKRGLNLLGRVQCQTQWQMKCPSYSMRYVVVQTLSTS